jgi:hypothetical protein
VADTVIDRSAPSQMHGVFELTMLVLASARERTIDEYRNLLNRNGR